MQHKCFIIIISIFLLGAASCERDPQLNIIDVPQCNLDSMCLEITDLDEYVVSIDKIQLGNDSTPFVVPKKVLRTDNKFMIILSGGQVFQFSDDGQYFRRLITPFNPVITNTAL